MKKLIVLIGVCILSLNAMAQDVASNSSTNSTSKYKYCAAMKDGKLVIKNEDKVLTEDAVLDNGTTVTMDGHLIMKDGTKKQIKSGQCVNSDGSIVTLEKKSKMKKENKSDNY